MNYSLNSSQIDEENLNLYEIPEFLKIIFSLAYYAISVWSVLGNMLIVWTVFYNKRMHNVTNFFIVNIAIADIIISLFCTPFQFHAAILQVNYFSLAIVFSLYKRLLFSIGNGLLYFVSWLHLQLL